MIRQNAEKVILPFHKSIKFMIFHRICAIIKLLCAFLMARQS
jgi:hypothetical protein